MKSTVVKSEFLQRKWVIVAFANFGIAALMGLLLRSAALVDLPWLNFRHMTHAHSHAAMMGWLYMAIFALLMHFFLSEYEQKKRKYQRTFIASQIAVIGMMASFPFQGYAAISISFSALHLFCSYAFLTFIWRNAKSENHQAIILLKTGIMLMMFSTLGVYALGPVTGKIGRLTDAYHLCIQFFLHFQFHGWFVFATAALFMQQLSKLGIGMKRAQFKAFHLLLLIASIGMMALPAAQYLHLPELLPLNTIGSMAQLAAVLVFFNFINQNKLQIDLQGNWVRYCAWMALGSILLKAIGQAALSWPEIALVPLNIRPMVIGFIHLLMLGMITSYLLMVLLQTNVLDASKRAFRSGVLFLFLGIIVTELLLFAQGISNWTGFGAWSFYNEALFAGSVLLVIGVFGLLAAIISNPKTQETQ
ncbi:MAG: hypothetical protein K9G41_04460 [Flavobacteriales bacterium]|nr:hypothetical protein [Flavobacteriales bacterium]